MPHEVAMDTCLSVIMPSTCACMASDLMDPCRSLLSCMYVCMYVCHVVLCKQSQGDMARTSVPATADDTPARIDASVQLQGRDPLERLSTVVIGCAQDPGGCNKFASRSPTNVIPLTPCTAKGSEVRT